MFTMVHRSPDSNAFEFIALASLRAHQLRRGCTQRVTGNHKQTTIAQMEIVAGKIERGDVPPAEIEKSIDK